MKRSSLPDELVAFTRDFDETLSISDDDLPSATHNQTRVFQLPGGVRDAWSLNTQHLGQQILTDGQDVIVAAVAHHQ